ncbi:MAG: M20/M25/M40 family metallo-hydrolase [Lachnospiraceae bacterium]|nr:M20/M25/M40 family metallo-hydrolase [Lachnospiraceae bacterium]
MQKKSVFLLMCAVLITSLSSCVRNMPQNVQSVDASVPADEAVASSPAETVAPAEDAAAAASNAPADTDASDVGIRQILLQSDAVAAEAYRLMCEMATEYPDRDITRADSDHGACRGWIIRTLREMGYEGQIRIDRHKVTQTGRADGDTAKENTFELSNIELTVPGKDPSRQIIVGAHYDGTGAGDNASGVGLLLAAANALKDTHPDLTVKIVFFDAEEEGYLGSIMYAGAMSEEEIASTVLMINLDALAFGDYCNIYGGVTDRKTGEVTRTEGYDLAVRYARELGFHVYGPEELDGYFEKYGEGPPPDEIGIFTNPWTKAHPMPSADSLHANLVVFSPSTADISVHRDFAARGIPYVYF